MKIGDRCFVSGYIDEIRKDTVIVRNSGGYFGTSPGEVITVYNTAHPNWIPCSERLPEEPIRVMAHLDNGWIITVYRQEEEWITVPDCGEPISDDEVIAWMPLPKAFREGEG